MKILVGNLHPGMCTGIEKCKSTDGSIVYDGYGTAGVHLLV